MTVTGVECSGNSGHSERRYNGTIQEIPYQEAKVKYFFLLHIIKSIFGYKLPLQTAFS